MDRTLSQSLEKTLSFNNHQARSETVQSQKSVGSLKTYKLKEQGEEILAGLSIGEAIASLIGKHRVTVSRWLSSYKAQGINALLTKGKSSGRKKKLSPSVEASLRQELIDEQGFSSYKEIQVWLRVVHDVKMSYTRTPNQKQFLC